MDKETALEHLRNTLLPNSNIRQEAEKAIKSFVQNNFQNSMALFIEITLDMSVPLPCRQMSSIIVKNRLHSKNRRIQKSYEVAWMNCSFDFRNRFVEMLSASLATKEYAILLNLTKIYGSILRIEIANGTPPTFFDSLFGGLKNQEYAIGILETVANACDQLYDETTYSFGPEKIKIYQISTFFLSSQSRPPRDVLLSTLKCIISTLDVYEDVLDTSQKRTEFLYTILTCEKYDPEITETTIELVSRFVSIYLEVMDDQELFPVCQFCLSYFTAQIEDIPIQAFEFWTLLLSWDAHESIFKRLIPNLVPNLMLCIQKEDPEDQSASQHKAACLLLQEISASKMGISFLNDPMYQNFILNNLTSTDPNKLAIGCTAIGSVMTPGVGDFIFQAIPSILNALDHEETVNEALFAIEKICEKDLSVLSQHITMILQKVGALIDQTSRTSINAISVYRSILRSIKNIQAPSELESALLFNYSNILSAFIYRLNNTASNDYELRSALSAGLTALIHFHPEKNKLVCDKLSDYLITRIATTISMIQNDQEQLRLELDDTMCTYVVLLIECMSLKKIFDPTQLTEIFMSILSLPKMLAQGEVYIGVSKLLMHLSVHLKKFVPYIVRDLSCDEAFVLRSALNLLSDCAVTLESNFVPFISVVVPALAHAITSSDVALELKPEIIETLGNVSLAAGRCFEPYISMCVLLLSQVNTLDRTNDEDYVDGLRRSAIQLFSCILVSVGDTIEIRKLASEIIENIKIAIQCDKDMAYTKESVNIIFDLQNVFGIDRIREDWIIQMLRSVVSHKQNEKESKKASELLEIFL